MKTIQLLRSEGKKKNIEGLARIYKHKGHETATGKLVRFNLKRGTKQQYHISGTINRRQTYSTTRSRTKKHYDKVHNRCTTDALVITATSKQEAIQLAEQEIVHQCSRNGKVTDDDDIYCGELKIKSVHGKRESRRWWSWSWWCLGWRERERRYY